MFEYKGTPVMYVCVLNIPLTDGSICMVAIGIVAGVWEVLRMAFDNGEAELYVSDRGDGVLGLVVAGR